MAEKMRIKKCQYGKHCKHGGIINLDEDECCVSGKDNNRYYHPDCKKEKDVMLEIIDFWYKNVDENPIFNQLRRTIDRLVYSDGYDAEYVLFALKAKYKYLQHPPGLVYAVKDSKVSREWDIAHKSVQAAVVKPEIKADTVFSYATQKKSKFSDIFGD